MKSFEQWKMDMDLTVATYDAKIQRLQMEIDAMKAVRDSYACASYPGCFKKRSNYEPGMEDCGK